MAIAISSDLRPMYKESDVNPATLQGGAAKPTKRQSQQDNMWTGRAAFWLCLLNVLLPPFPPSLLPSFPPSLLPSFPPSLLPSFPPSLLPSFPPSLLPSFPPSLLPSFPCVLHVFLPSFAEGRAVESSPLLAVLVSLWRLFLFLFRWGLRGCPPCCFVISSPCGLSPGSALQGPWVLHNPRSRMSVEDGKATAQHG